MTFFRGCNSLFCWSYYVLFGIWCRELFERSNLWRFQRLKLIWINSIWLLSLWRNTSWFSVWFFVQKLFCTLQGKITTPRHLSCKATFRIDFSIRSPLVLWMSGKYRYFTFDFIMQFSLIQGIKTWLLMPLYRYISCGSITMLPWMRNFSCEKLLQILD